MRAGPRPPFSPCPLPLRSLYYPLSRHFLVPHNRCEFNQCDTARFSSPRISRRATGSAQCVHSHRLRPCFHQAWSTYVMPCLCAQSTRQVFTLYHPDGLELSRYSTFFHRHFGRVKVLQDFHFPCNAQRISLHHSSKQGDWFLQKHPTESQMPYFSFYDLFMRMLREQIPLLTIHHCRVCRFVEGIKAPP